MSLIIEPFNSRRLIAIIASVIAAIVCLLVAPAVHASDLLQSFSQQDSTTGLRQALQQAAEKSVAQLGANNGFWSNPEVKIALPENIHRLTKTFKKLGMSKPIDELEMRMNRAAEAAMPIAKDLLIQSVKKLSIADAKTILQGSDTSATDYFRQTTTTPLTEKFLPIVRAEMQKVQVADAYQAVASKASALGLISAKDADLEAHITQKALDGLFTIMAKEERAIRANPQQAIGNLAKKLFSQL